MTDSIIARQVADFLQTRIPEAPVMGIVLGSGLSEFSDRIKDKTPISYSIIPHYPQPTVTGHVGEFIFGYLSNIPVLCARGRFHYYEGHPIETVTLPIRVFKEIGCSAVIITNAAGCMNPHWNVGDLMVIEGHYDFTCRQDANDPELRNNLDYYDPNLIALAKHAAQKAGLVLRNGNYCWTLGPTYETPAEITDMHNLGGDAVGMSTVPEIEEANRQQLKVLGISCLTNYAAGMTAEPLNHLEVLDTTQRVKVQFSELITSIIVNYTP
ncbi:MAG: purine-nucleoside phosphorylase [Candidatus Marinimicrobia bacterium]|nr:purine-nucleoside phosphorylase [Candidatus Neomarinimicrobiota bacterium]